VRAGMPVLAVPAVPRAPTEDRLLLPLLCPLCPLLVPVGPGLLPVLCWVLGLAPSPPRSSVATGNIPLSSSCRLPLLALLGLLAGLVLPPGCPSPHCPAMLSWKPP